MRSGTSVAVLVHLSIKEKAMKIQRKSWYGLAICVLVTSLAIAVVAMAEDIGKEVKETAVTLVDMPQVVQEVILKESQGFKLGELLEVVTDRGVYYEADWIDGVDEVGILLAADGTVIDREREKADADDQEDDEQDDDDQDSEG
mgnify:CR=1 FL=1